AGGGRGGADGGVGADDAAPGQGGGLPDDLRAGMPVDERGRVDRPPRHGRYAGTRYNAPARLPSASTTYTREGLPGVGPDDARTRARGGKVYAMFNNNGSSPTAHCHSTCAAPAARQSPSPHPTPPSSH